MRFLRPRPVAGLIAFDHAEEEAHLHHSGGTRLATDVSDSEVALLARCMSYKFGILGIKIIGAKAAIRARAHIMPDLRPIRQRVDHRLGRPERRCGARPGRGRASRSVTATASNAITRTPAAMCALSVPGADDPRWRQPGEPRF